MYVNPFWALSWTLEDDRSFDVHEFQRRRNQLALEFEVSPTGTLDMGGVTYKRDDVLNGVDRLRDDRGRHFHWLVYRSPRLNAFLMQAPGSVWTGSVTPAEQREWSDLGFGEFVNSVFSPEFAHRLRVALKDSNVGSLRGLSGELPPGVSPDDCYATGCALVEQTVANRLREIEHQLDEPRGVDAPARAGIRDLRNQALGVVDVMLLNMLPSYFSDQRNMIGELLRRIAWSVRRDVQLDNATLPLLERANDLRLDGMAAKNVNEALEQARVGTRPESASAAAFWAAERQTQRCPYCKEIIPADSVICPNPSCHTVLRETVEIAPPNSRPGASHAPAHKCSWCEYDVPDGVQICPRCGRPVCAPPGSVHHHADPERSPHVESGPQMECPHCHKTVPANTYFCANCGCILRPEVPESEARATTASARPSPKQPEVVEGQWRARTASTKQPNKRTRIFIRRGPLMALISVALLIAALVIYGLIVSAAHRSSSTVPEVSTPVASVPVVVAEPPVVTPAPVKQPVLPKASPRPTNGATLKRAAGFGGGLGTLAIHNGTDEDGIIKLVAVGSTSLSLAVYIQSNSTTTVSSIPDGSYQVLFATGRGYYAAKKSFVSGLNCSVFDTDLDYRTTESTYSTWSITLNAVANGNASTSPVSDSAFEGY